MSNRMQNLTGQSILSISGNTYNLIELVGSGSQGVVYREASGKHMVKLYYPNNVPQFDKDILEKISFVKRVKKPRNFVEIRDLIDVPYVGYVMDRVVDHKPLNSYLIPPRGGEFKEWYHSGQGLRERLCIGWIIAKAFSDLSADNLSYCDISGNNILIKVNDKEVSVRMIDIDNIYVAGRGKSSVLGTPRYIAPEVINKTRNPDVFSDNYSLAVIIFELLRIGHPYVSDEVADGTPEEEDAAYAGNCDYVTPDNSKYMLPEEVAFTDKLKILFEKCFNDGKKNRMERPSAKDFEFALLDARNKVIKCDNCEAWHYPRKESNEYRCPWCGNISSPDAYLTFYDKFFSVTDDIDNAKEEQGRKAISTYFLRDGQNIIHGSYILRTVSGSVSGKDNRNESYFTIVKNDSGYHAYNKFGKTDIFVKKYSSGKMIRLESQKAELLDKGDEIFFDVPNRKKDTVEKGKNKYKLIRTAVFVEVT